MLIALPLLLIPVVIYNIVVLSGMMGSNGALQADAVLRDPIFSIPMTSGANWDVGVGDLILFLAFFIVTIIAARKDLEFGGG